MTKRTSKLLSLLLAASMVLTMNVTSFAAGSKVVADSDAGIEAINAKTELPKGWSLVSADKADFCDYDAKTKTFTITTESQIELKGTTESEGFKITTAANANQNGYYRTNFFVNVRAGKVGSSVSINVGKGVIFDWYLPDNNYDDDYSSTAWVYLDYNYNEKDETRTYTFTTRAYTYDEEYVYEDLLLYNGKEVVISSNKTDYNFELWYDKGLSYNGATHIGHWKKGVSFNNTGKKQGDLWTGDLEIYNKDGYVGYISENQLEITVKNGKNATVSWDGSKFVPASTMKKASKQAYIQIKISSKAVVRKYDKTSGKFSEMDKKEAKKIIKDLNKTQKEGIKKLKGGFVMPAVPGSEKYKEERAAEYAVPVVYIAPASLPGTTAGSTPSVTDKAVKNLTATFKYSGVSKGKSDATIKLKFDKKEKGKGDFIKKTDGGKTYLIGEGNFYGKREVK